MARWWCATGCSSSPDRAGSPLGAVARHPLWMALDGVENALTLVVVARAQHRAKHRLEQIEPLTFPELRNRQLVAGMPAEQLVRARHSTRNLACVDDRSEERRVGKEWRLWRAAQRQ